MSRCFPFPPPGYEKKARTDDVDILKKEKQKEKKHKKEKKDKEKEKRENKDRKENRVDGKRKDKKDKKEKHKDKKKEKDKEKDRSNIAEEKCLSRLEGQNGEKNLDEKKISGKYEGHSGEKFIHTEKGRDKDAKKTVGQYSGYNGEKISQNSHLPEDVSDSKFLQESERRVKDEGAGVGKPLLDKFMGTDRKRDEEMVRLVARTANTLGQEKEKKKSDDRRLDVPGIKEDSRSGRNAMVQNLAGATKARVEAIPRQVENNIEGRDEGREKFKEKESGDKIRDKRKDREREKKSHGKDKDRNKEKKDKEKDKEKEAKAKGEHKNLELDNLKVSNKDDPVHMFNMKPSYPSKDSNKGAIIEENHHKRKDLEKNGFLRVNDIKPNKLPKTLMDNGRSPESCQAPIQLSSDSQRTQSIIKEGSKERKVNGIIEAQLLSISPTKHLAASAQASQIDEVSMKPPHPDSKYLSQVFSVPKMEEWCDFDDQSWLFQINESQSKKPEVGFSEIDEAPQVWAEALQIESADICALPYVIPY